MRRFTIVSLLCLSILAGQISTAGSKGAASSDVTLSRSDDSGISLNYHPPVLNLVPGADNIIKMKIPGYGTDPDSYGNYRPFKRYLVILPPNSRVELSVSGQKIRTIDNCSVERAFPDTVNITDSDNKIPSTAFITLSEPFRYRRYWAAELILQPAVYDEVKRAAQILENARIDINFIGGEPSGYTEPGGEKFAGLFLNFQQGKNWAIPPERYTENAFFDGVPLKISIDEEGIYKITRSQIIQSVPHIADYDLTKIKLYNNGGRELPVSTFTTTSSSLIENPVYVYDADSDNIWDAEDFILFYGKAASGWDNANNSWAHYINHFTLENIYWLELNNSGTDGLRMADFRPAPGTGTAVSTTKARLFREDEKFIYANGNFSDSGLNWYGDMISAGSSKSYIHTLSDVASGYYKIRVKLFSTTGGSSCAILWNNTQIGTSSAFSSAVTFSGDNLSQEGLNTLKFQSTSSNSAYLDYYEIEYEKFLTASNNSAYIESPIITGTVEYDTILGLTGQIYYFKITDPTGVGMFKNGAFFDNASSSVRDKYIVCGETAFKTPGQIALYNPPPSDFADLRAASNSAQYVYIAHSDFYNEITPVVNLWASQGTNVARVNIQQVFDQFSWGLTDPAGIRNFIKYAVDNWAVPPAMFCFVGDGDYDYLNRLSAADKNWIPPYENGEKCYDDYYSYLHTNGIPEVALGRWTVQSPEQAQIVADKILKYTSDPEWGLWKTRFTVVADDEYGEGGQPSSWEQIHSTKSEELAEIYLPKFFNTEKIYEVDFPVAIGPGGRQKPLATEKLLAAIYKGSVFVNYFGHGNEIVWSHENLFNDERDVPVVDCGDKQAIYVAMTCDWGWFDNALKQSMPENLLVLPGNGAIASIAATRPTVSDPNWDLAVEFYTHIYQDEFNPVSIGEALFAGKVQVGGSNSEKYHLIGDPMLVPCSPRSEGAIDDMTPDSLLALNLVTLSGRTLQNDTVWTTFDGTVYLQARDAAYTKTYQFANSGNIFSYKVPGNVIFRGPYSAAGGAFSGQFVVPFDLQTYGGSLGRVSIYYTDGISDGCAYKDSVYTGSGGTAIIDNDLPSAKIYFGDRSWLPGSPISASPSVIVDLADSSGVNLTGFTGHKILLTADEMDEFDLTDYFDYETDSYKRGSLTAQLDYLEPGIHQMKFRVFDSFNKVFQTEFTVETVETGTSEESLFDLLNYPNPFADSTAFTFKILQAASVKIDIFTVAGKKIASLGPKYCAPTFVCDEFLWDGKDREGDEIANGVYLYKVTADFGSEKISKIGRLIVMH